MPLFIRTVLKRAIPEIMGPKTGWAASKIVLKLVA
jgi:hypothetical protein